VGFALWEIAALLAQTRSFPHLWNVISDLFTLIPSEVFWADLGITLWLSICGLFLGSVVAIVLGLFIGLNRHGAISSTGVLNFLRSVPSVVFLPLLVASIGSSARTAVILTMMVVSFKLVIYVIRGVKDTEPLLLESANAMGIPALSKVLLIYLPSAIPIFGTGIRLSASRAFGTVIAAGIVGGTPGLGSKLYLAEAAGNYPRTFSYVLIMGIMGVGIYSLFSMIERKFFVWRVAV
jgi:ABC-type nitrate/sulfonate/bicarbonate transport system permease component